MSSPDVDIFISVHVSSLGAAAKKLQEELEELGKKVFLSTELQAGVNYRNSISTSVKACKVFLPLMNQPWGESGECIDEFLLAKRLNLTSHERGATKPPNEARRPVLLPIAFPSLAPWPRYPHVELLSASTNFFCIKQEDLEDVVSRKHIVELAVRMCDDESHLNTSSIEGLAMMKFGNIRASLDALEVYLQQASMTLSDAMSQATSNDQNTSAQTQSPRAVEVGSSYPFPKPTYIGVTTGQVNDFVKSIFSLELQIDPIDQASSTTGKSYTITATVVYKVLQILTQPGFEQLADYNEIMKLKESIDKEAEIKVQGEFDSEKGLLMLDDVEVVKDDLSFTSMPNWKYDAYRLLLSSDAQQLNGTLRGMDGQWSIAFRAEAF